MKHISSPFLPQSRVSLLIVSDDMPEEMRKRLHSDISRVVTIPPLKSLPDPLMNHPDLQLACPAEGVIVYAPDMDRATVDLLSNYGFSMTPGERRPTGKYPSDVPYNAAVIGKQAFLNVRFSDPVVLKCLVKAGISVNHINQGYAKCSICMLNEEALITSDIGIYRAACAKNIDVLLIPPQKNITLAGFDHGFIGGATGLISKKELAITGEINKLDDAGLIMRFLDKYGVRPVSLGVGNVLDLGSLIPLCSV